MIGICLSLQAFRGEPLENCLLLRRKVFLDLQAFDEPALPIRTPRVHRELAQLKKVEARSLEVFEFRRRAQERSAIIAGFFCVMDVPRRHELHAPEPMPTGSIANLRESVAGSI
jgi:hypothetical protein